MGLRDQRRLGARYKDRRFVNCEDIDIVWGWGVDIARERSDTSRCLVISAAEARRARQSLSMWADGETEVGGSRLGEYVTHSGNSQRASSCG